MSDDKAEREERLAAALRENLRRRKARARGEEAIATDGSDTANPARDRSS